MPTSPETADERRTEAEVKLLISQRDRHFRSLQILYDLSKQVHKDKSAKSNFHARSKHLEKIKTEFYEICNTLNLRYLELSREKDVDDKVLDSFDVLYYEVIKTQLLLESETAKSTTSVPQKTQPSAPEHTAQVRLPKLQIPKFDGTVENWQTFKDSYLPLIHNNGSLSNIEKFHYLISVLSGFALTIAKGLPLTEANYPIVYQLLLDRYDNERVLAAAYLDKVFNLPTLNKPSLECLNSLSNTLYESVNALRALKIQNLSEFLLFYIASKKLDGDTRQRFELQNKERIPTFDMLLSFLQDFVRVLEVSKTANQTSTVSHGNKTQRTKNDYSPHQSKSSFVASTRAEKQQHNLCPCCNLPHSIYKCFKLQNLNTTSRYQLIKDLNLCSNCLRAGHYSSSCNSKTSCMICGLRHNTLLHTNNSDNKRFSVAASGPEANPTASARAAAAAAARSSVSSDSVTQGQSASLSCATARSSESADALRSTKILGSAIVCVRNKKGATLTARALIDSCSMDSFITNACAHRLGLPVRKYDMSVTGLGQGSVPIKGVTFCSITPRNNEEPQFELPLVVIPQITSLMPRAPLPSYVRKHFSHLELADDKFDEPCRIDILLGVECFDRIYTGQRYAPGPGLPCALASVFGWVIMGQVKHSELHIAANEVASLLTSTCALDDILQRFWEVEEPPAAIVSVPEDDICEQKYVSETYRNSEGRYVVPLMLKDPAVGLGDSYRQSLNRFLNLEKRLLREPELKAEYTDFMRQYEELGHMQPVDSSPTTAAYVIPHHCVVRPESVSTRLRVVFDASCRTTNHKSLNDVVYAGPKLQIDVVDLITKFRLHAVVFTADICKMFRQILIRPEDRKYQHILWRETPDAPLKEYRLDTVTYGVTSSPFLAIRTLRQLASDYASEYPHAARALREETFMDDVTTGAPTLEEAKILKRELISLLSVGKFDLRKWSSNNPELLADIPAEHCQSPKQFEQADGLTLKILGIKWDPARDCFTFSFNDDFKVEFTKRSILSIVARIFDPLGWICPLIFSAKLLLQEMWRHKLTWDEPIPGDLAKQWHLLAANFSDMQNVKLPRVILPPNPTEIHLVGFCDGSSKGYGCCVYLVAVTELGNTISLIMGKSKVAPLKIMTVNRLELCAAVLLARVLSHVYELLKTKLTITSVKAFTDSSTVLSWINTPSHLLKMFVANRVVMITDLICAESWSHVSTHDNAADCCSRGTSCAELVSHSLWWTGPSWLASQPSDWPSQKQLLSHQELPEINNPPSESLVTTNSEGQDFLSDLSSKFSSLTRLQRVLAWVMRFIKNARNKGQSRDISSLSTAELNNALHVLIRDVQEKSFSQEFKSLKEGGTPCRKSIQKLSPFIDDAGLLRVGGRIRHANLPNSWKHPLLIPKRSYLAQLIVDTSHLTHLHCGPRTLQSLIQRRFWILGIRLLIRSRISKCVVCFKSKPVPCQPIMGDLPPFRLLPGKCFQSTGIDFGGPFTLKESRRRNAPTYKAWLCLFVCLKTKAVHLEIVTELSTEAFLAALDRFISRRGQCNTIISDCGTNFVGAKRYLNEMRNTFYSNSREVTEGLSVRHINWQFNPPSAPHFGGIFESGIKSTKYHLKRVVGSQVLTLEEMITILTKTEAILNSRPLCALSSDPDEVDVLTPGHFLVGGPLVGLPEPPLEEMSLSPRSRWQMLQRLIQSFWRIWQRDYLHTLQQKNKWLNPYPNLKLNDLVLIVEPNLPTLSWRLGKIIELHPGKDHVVRVVTVQTANGHKFRRPVVKTCPLPK